MRRRPIGSIWLLTVAILAWGCAGATPTPSPTPGPVLMEAELRYRLIDRFGPRWFCDPDSYPIPRGEEADLAIQRFPDVRRDRDAFDTIVAHLGLTSSDDFTAAQKLRIYRAWKQLNATFLDPIGNSTYRFDYLAVPPAGADRGQRTAGTIDDRGTITIEQQAPAGEPPCPICLARGTRIATPDGTVPVEHIRVGMRVWSADETGRPIVEVVLRAGRVAVGPWHRVIRLVLHDGRTVRASPEHPLADGRRLDTIRPGDLVDGTTVLVAAAERYDGGETFDILPSGPTGTYWAERVLLGSTLAGDSRLRSYASVLAVRSMYGQLTP